MMAALARFRSVIVSPLSGVSDEAWEKFVYAMDVQPIGAVSSSGGFGSFDMRPRRLVELGLMSKLRYVRMLDGREVYEGKFVGIVDGLPLTRERFLNDITIQHEILAKSMVAYDEELKKMLAKLDGLSRAGVLAILHRGGRGALAKWPEMFSDTAALVARCQGCF